MEVPNYFLRGWEEFRRGYDPEVATFEQITKMKVDRCRPPFICAGNIEDRQTEKMLTFGLNPSSGGAEYIPTSAEDSYRWRCNYFNTEEIPHKIHQYFGRLSRGLVGSFQGPPPSRWLHSSGYLTFDMFKYYAKWVDPRKWRPPGWESSLIFGLAKDHFTHCLNLLQGHRIRCAVFTGGLWVPFFHKIERDLCSFAEKGSFPLSRVKERANRDVEIRVGEISGSVCRSPFPAAVIPGLIHGKYLGLSYEDAFKLGEYIGRLL